MNERELASRFDGRRPQLRAVAYRILGSVTEADDAVQEACQRLGIALQVVLDTLSPAERLAFVLHDMFAVPFDEIAAMVDRSPQATRQLGGGVVPNGINPASPPFRQATDACQLPSGDSGRRRPT